MSRAEPIALAVVAIISLGIAVYLGGVLHIWSLHNVDLFPDRLIDAIYTFYRLPAVATQSLLPEGIIGGAPQWMWIAVLFFGVYGQNVLLWALTRMLLKKGRALGT